MSITASDISLLLSGGTGNSNAKLSLGGDPSSQPVLGVVNSLFDNMSPEGIKDGRTDYRCLYLANRSEFYTMYSCGLYVHSQPVGGAEIYLGLLSSNDVTQISEVQRVVVVGSVTGGSFTLRHTDTNGATANFTVDYHSDPERWADNFETAANALNELIGMTVSVTQSNGSTRFRTTFAGVGAGRHQSILTLVANNLTGASSTITIQKLKNGSPVNSIAEQLPDSTATPSGVQFISATALSPLLLGGLRPGDKVPFWIKRVVPANSDSMANDGFTLRVTGSPLNA